MSRPDPMETSDAESLAAVRWHVLDAVRMAEKRRDPPLLCAMEVGRRVISECGMGVPSLELGQVLVDSLCFENNTPIMWKLLDQAITSGLVFPTHVLALLTARVLPSRLTQPEAYGLYLDLLGRHMFSFSSLRSSTSLQKLIKSIDDNLQLSSFYEIQIRDVGTMIVLFTFSIIVRLLDSALKDHGLYIDAKWQKMVYTFGDNNVDIEDNDKRSGRRVILHKRNSIIVLDIIESITTHRKTQIFLRLMHLYMSEKFNYMMQRLKFINGQETTPHAQMLASSSLVRITVNITKAVDKRFWLTGNKLIHSLISMGTQKLSSFRLSGAGRSACWTIFDVLLENAMDGRHLYHTSAIIVLKELTMTLQVVNQASWQETFEALWISALRLVQRGNEDLDGPIPKIDVRLCTLLAIIPLAVCDLIKEEEVPSSSERGSQCTEDSSENHMNRNIYSSRRHGLVSSLQQLQQYSGLLTPPPSVVAAANVAAAKAATFLIDHKRRHGNIDGTTDVGVYSKASGNMLHLIVEACISRKLIDTSAYFWPGYVVISPGSSADSNSVQESPWTKFMEGAELKDYLVNSLKMTPALSLEQVHKLHQIGLNGSHDERSAAAEILCGASLSQGWNIQEHVVQCVVKLLAPPVPPDFDGPDSHLLGHMSMLNSVLLGASCIDAVHIISLYGMVPALAVALMPLCEVFGSLSPTSCPLGRAKDEISIFSVFSRAFLFLLRLWKFYRLPHKHGIGIADCWGVVEPELTLEYLILMHNKSIVSQSSPGRHTVAEPHDSLISHPVSMDSFPKLKGWCFRNQSSVSSTTSGSCYAKPACQVADKILYMICQKMNKVRSRSGNSSSPTSSNSMNNSSSSLSEDTFQKPFYPAWEILEAIPFVLEAILTACASGRLSSRELTTGMRNIVDFLPAALAIIISYLCAEITRGTWKPVQMNGIDWPSPAANLGSIESEIADILASAGVHVSNCYVGSKTAIMLPLPMAALLSLTITFKLDKSSEYLDSVAGQGLENCAACCSWPSVAVAGALWAQKVRRWHDFIVFSCARYPFMQDRNAISQLLRSCFSSFLGTSVASGTHLSSRRGINGLLSCAYSNHRSRLLAAPGFLYLRSCRSFLDTKFVCGEILKLVIGHTRDLTSGWSCGGPANLASCQTSLISAVAGAREIAMLGASFVCICGGIMLVHLLYVDIIPTWLLSETNEKGSASVPACFILEGYSMAYMMLLCGFIAWGIREDGYGVATKCLPNRRRAISVHLEFMANVMRGNISLKCSPITWKSYVSCFLGLMLEYAPMWISYVKLETLQRLAEGLREWHESELALALLERGGPSVMECIVNIIL